MTEARRLFVEDADHSTVLLDVAGPTLYRANMFRVTGLPVNATARDIRHRRQELKVGSALGTVATDNNPQLPLDPPPDADTVKDALQRLQDLERRLVDELFWLWQTDGADDTASSGLGQEHDLAVMLHCQALDLEHRALSQTLSDEDRTRRDSCWSEGLRRWAALGDRRELWDRLNRRVREVADPRLTTGTVRGMRAMLPLALLSVNAQLAVEAAEQGDERNAQRHARLMLQSPFDPSVADRAIRRAIEPVLKRLRLACEATDGNSLGDGSTADATGRRIREQTRPTLATLRCVLTPDHPAAQAIHDEVAAALNLCAVAYWNAKSDGEAAHGLLASALPLATQAATRELIQRNLKNIPYNPVWARFPKVKELCEQGKIDKAYIAVRGWRRTIEDPDFRKQADEWLAEPRYFSAKTHQVPQLQTWNGWGSVLYGSRAKDSQNNTWAATLFFVAFFIPLIPLSSYIVGPVMQGRRYFYGKVPLSQTTRWWRRLLLPLAFYAIYLNPMLYGYTEALVGIAILGMTIAIYLYREKVLGKSISSLPG